MGRGGSDGYRHSEKVKKKKSGYDNKEREDSF